VNSRLASDPLLAPDPEPDLRTMAELEAEADALIARLKCRWSDRGIAGVSDAEFKLGWDGVRLKSPAFHRDL
jgi:hypothetical protein